MNGNDVKDPPNPKKKRSERPHKPKIELPDAPEVNFTFNPNEDSFIVVHFIDGESTRHDLMINGISPWQMALVVADLNERAKLGLRENIVMNKTRARQLGLARVDPKNPPPIQ